jgi:tetratricopeptide (TPR) repeat protein
MNHDQATEKVRTQVLTAASFPRPGVMEIAACGISALVYIATLSFGFVYDDVPQILKNPAIHGWNSVPQYFTSHVWAAIYPNTSGNYYRPLFLLWLRLNYFLFGTNAAGWHLTSVLCHVAATWLVFRLAQKLTGDRLTAFVTALVFGMHPSHIENVAWISGVTDPLMACFLLASFLAFLDFGEPHRVLPATLSLGLFALALLSKETAVVLPVLIFAYVLILGPNAKSNDGAARRFVAAFRSSVPYLLLLLVYAVVRFRALGGWSHPTIPISWTETLLTWPAVLWFYARHLILPVHLSEFYALDYVTHAAAADVLLPLALLLLVVAAVCLVLFFLLRERSEKNVARFALVLIVAPLLPVLDLRSLTTGDIVHDRYLYLPSVGFALLVGLAVRGLSQSSHLREGRLRILPVAFGVTIVAGLAGLTLVEQMPWANDIGLYTRGVESAPANLTVRDNLANTLLDAGQPSRAIPLYLEVLGRNSNFWRSNYNLGFAYYKTGNFAGAQDYLQRAIRIDPGDSDQYIYLALVQLQLKKLPEAAENARRAIARSAHARGYHSVLALIDEAAGDQIQAAAELKTEIAEHPENAVAAAELQRLEETQTPPKP